MVVIKPDGNGRYNDVSIDSNFVLSAYGRNNPKGFIRRLSDNSDNIIFADKKRTRILLGGLGLQLPKFFNNIEFNKIIHQTRNVVKGDVENSSFATSKTNPFVKENIRYSSDINRAEQNKKDKAEFGISINQYAGELMRDIGVPEEQTNEYLELALRHAAGLVKNGQSEAAVSALELINFSLSGS